MFKRLVCKIKENKYSVFTLVSVLAIVFWYLNFRSWSHNLIYLLCFVVYFSLNSVWLGKILNRRGFEKELQFIFGFFCLLYLIAFGLAVPIVAYKVTPVCLLVWLIFLTLAISFWARTGKQEPEPAMLETEIEKGEKDIKVSKTVYVFWFILLFGCLFLLFYARTGEYVDSPWKIIHPLYLYAWLGIVFILGFSAFSKIKLKYFLVIVILASFLCHVYLLIPYQTGFGGDKWRHIGAEEWLARGKVYEPALFGKDAPYKQLGPFKIPEVLIVGNKTSYANMWGLTIALSWLTGIKIFYLDLILGFLLFSVFLPFLLLKLGLFFSRKKEFLFLLLLMPFCFYPFQAYAGITFPLTFSFLLFLFSLIFIARYLTRENSSKKLFWSLVFFIPLLYFSYLVYLVLFLEMFVLAILIKHLKQNRKIFIPLIILFSLVLLILIPGLETYNQYSWLKNEIPLKIQVIEMLKDFPLKLASSQAIFPRIYGFEQDNWLFAIVDKDLSRSVLLKLLPWYLILTPILWLLVIFGFWQFKKAKNPNLGLLFFLMLIIVLTNQMLSSYLMDGNHLLTKRLVVFTSFLFFAPLTWGICVLKEKAGRMFSSKTVIFILVLFLALLSTAVYASGPKFQVVTDDEYRAAKYVWQELEKEPAEKYCVLANTWPLLALEGISGREVVTGGFPYYYEYRQPERVQLFENMNANPSIRYLEKSLEITQAQKCYFMTEERWVYFDKRGEIIEQFDKILGQHENIGKVMIWLYQPNEVMPIYK